MTQFTLNARDIGPGQPTYMIAELSANHGGSLQQALDVIRAMKAAGADAVKLQTYTADTLTLKCDRPEFQVGEGTLWEGRTLHDLYEEAHTPWEWHPELFQLARELGMVDLPLIKYIASKGRPIIMSTGMGSLAEISEAVAIVKSAGVPLALLKCTSAYPSLPESMNLRTIPHLAEAFHVPTGLSDHTLGISVPVAAVALGACIIEKHFTLSRNDPGPDSAFSLEPDEFKALVDSVRVTEKALGKVNYELTEKEQASKAFRRSLFVVEDIKKGEAFTPQNVRSIRPGNGMAPSNLDRVLLRKAATDIDRGTPLSESHLS
jgi:pseudaminic acid synthase